MSEHYESIVERRIREAQENGAFDGLAGAGRPLPGLHPPDDENWWLRGFLEREGIPSSAALPASLQLRREIERLPETVRDLRTEREVREVVRRLNERVAAWIRNPSGPRVGVRPASADDIVAGWEEARAARSAREPGLRSVPVGMPDEPVPHEPVREEPRAGDEPARDEPRAGRRRRQAFWQRHH